ncbi:MAG: LacI family DNA-binding transcriptional regulator [Anaerolineae bacterium]|nr:LacI family DNA-binding transcriptional regulator [Anaerolineae bacterium]
MTATLRDIAQRANVSITTVSRILNGRESGVPIREETRQRVLSVAAELGYRPNLLARGLRGSHSSLVGVIVRDMSEPFFSQILRGIHQAAISRQYRLFLGSVERQPNVAIDYGSMFEQSHADGIIIIGDTEHDDQAIEWLAGKHRSVVGITDRTKRRAIPGVYADSVMGARLAMEHLWALGHRHISCVTDTSITDGRVRADTYEQYMREHGANDPAIHILTTTRTPEGGFQTGQAIFGTSARPTAIFAATDTIAIGLLQAAFQCGVSVPDDVSIIGYDDIDMAPFTIPPLTTISQSGFDMGYAGANLLLDMIEQQLDGTQINDVILNPTLVVRQSTDVPRA